MFQSAIDKISCSDIVKEQKTGLGKACYNGDGGARRPRTTMGGRTIVTITLHSLNWLVIGEHYNTEVSDV